MSRLKHLDDETLWWEAHARAEGSLTDESSYEHARAARDELLTRRYTLQRTHLPYVIMGEMCPEMTDEELTAFEMMKSAIAALDEAMQRTSA